MKQLVEVKFQRTSSQRGSSAAGSPTSEASTAVANKDAGEPSASCPSCKNALKQSSRIFVLRKCGHALCQACVDALVLAPMKLSTAKLADMAKSATNGKEKEEKESKKSAEAGSEGEARCAVCDKKVKDPLKDVIRLQSEGTGFAAAGNAEAKRVGTAFQA
jgi:Zinc finger, C3HC4 type (RING finger)